ncbi:DUF3240 family protein [Sphingomonas sp.]|uniref:DUF3240 family protein n=1 Tax=Sphingomonas sp. TaxID=28214 RepID=UPI000DB57B40|nr:DUF3240 family protein [Sphingomonas sp.]PZU11515.1 MAG: DUF3240 domain-containing protein [Sphingomonas sp.]
MTGDVLLRLTCATGDVDPLVDALRAVSAPPIHVRDEMVRGLDFADAGTAERVTGALRRSAIELTVHDRDLDRLIDAAAGTRRRLPVRWIVLPVLRGGRIA